MQRDIHAEFLSYLQSDRARGLNFENRDFYFPRRITRWLMQKPPNETSSNAVRLFATIYNEKNSTGTFLLNLKDEEVERCPILFAILIKIDCGHMFHIFRHSIRDDYLGIPDLSDLYTDIERALAGDHVKLPTRYKNTEYRGVTDEFDKQRWAFNPALNVLNMGEQHVEGKSVLPFSDGEIINIGGTANVHHYKIHSHLVESKTLRQILEPTKQDPTSGMEYYEFAVKTYLKGYEDIYKLESEAFRGFNSTKDPKSLGVVTYLGEYTIQDRGTENELPRGKTHHIMLEYGEQDLDEYLAVVYPPVSNGEILAFWESLFGVANTLARIHQLEHVRGDSIQRYIGWHGDIKPDNILRVRGKFKLADFGFTRFEKSIIGKPQTTHLLGGTRTYGAPERDTSNGEAGRLVTPTIDTWSLGCVFSAVASWVVLGAQGYENYSEIRLLAHERLHERRKASPRLDAPSCIDAFHDGFQVLPAVLQWHDYLRNSSRKADTITCRVLDLVESGMLEKDPEKRLSSADLCNRLDAILADAKADYQSAVESHSPTPPSQEILDALLELDKRAPKFAEPRSWAATEGNDTSKGETLWTANTRNHTSKLAVSKSSRVKKSERINRILQGKTANREEAIQPGSTSGAIFELPNNELTISTGGVASRNSSQALKSDSRPRSGQDAHSLSVVNYMHSEQDPAASMHSKPPESESPINSTFSTQQSGRHSTRLPTIRSLAPRNRSLRRRQEVPMVQEYNRLYAIWNKSNKWWAIQREVPRDEYLSQFIDNRDIIFVVDNAASMSSHWADVTTTLLGLAMKISMLNKDGLDLKFTIGEKHNIDSAKEKRILHKFSKSLESVEQNMNPRNTTNMATALSKIFDDYQNYEKKQTLIVLTDGLWEASENEESVANTIAEFIKSLRGRLKEGQRRWFTLQFVSFGLDERALKRLRRLHDDLEALAAEGVVDWKPWDSAEPDLLIIGSLVPQLDSQLAAPDTVIPAAISLHPSQPPTPSSKSKRRRLSKIFGLGDWISPKEAKQPLNASTTSSREAQPRADSGEVLATLNKRQEPSVLLNEYDTASRPPTYNEYTDGKKDESARLESLTLEIRRLKGAKHNNTKTNSSLKEDSTNDSNTLPCPKCKKPQWDSDASQLLDVYYMLQPLWRVSSVIADSWKRCIEIIAGTQLSWWPLADPEVAPKPGFTRIYSVLFSEANLTSRRFYDDIPTSSAQRLFPRLSNPSHSPFTTGLQALGHQAVILRETTLMQVLNQSKNRGDRMASPETELAYPQIVKLRSDTGMTPMDVGRMIGKAEILTSEDQQQSQRLAEASVQGRGKDIKTSEPVLYLTAKIGREESVACAVKPGVNDQQTLQSLRKAFRSLPSSRWKVATGLKFYKVMWLDDTNQEIAAYKSQFQSFRFRQQSNRCSVVIHEDQERYPRKEDLEYQHYQYKPRPWDYGIELPCLGGEAWYFYTNQDECGTSVELNDAFPTRMGEPHKKPRFTGWSIHIQQRYSIWVIFIPVLAVTIIALVSTMWFIPGWLGKHEDDLQNATVPVTLALTTVQFMVQLLVSLVIFRWSL